MPLNFTGRAPPPPPPPPPAADKRFSPLAGACLALAGLAAGAAVLIPLNRPKPADALPPLAGASRPLAEPVAASPSAPAPAPAPASRAAPPAIQPAPGPDRQARFLAALRRSAPGAITLAVEDDAGAQAYGRQLAALFRAAGWTVTWNAVFGAAPPGQGLSAALGQTTADLAVRDAFGAAGIRLAPPPAATGIVQTPELFVGAAHQ
jgi:hypothetical protein